jgi:hypothetical protein
LPDPPPIQIHAQSQSEEWCPDPDLLPPEAAAAARIIKTIPIIINTILKKPQQI